MHHTAVHRNLAPKHELDAVTGRAAGLVALPGDRKVWWTGRVAIGLRYNLRPDERLDPREFDATVVSRDDGPVLGLRPAAKLKARAPAASVVPR